MFSIQASLLNIHVTQSLHLCSEFFLPVVSHTLPAGLLPCTPTPFSLRSLKKKSYCFMKTVQMKHEREREREQARERERERAFDPSKMLCAFLPRHRVQMSGQLPIGHLNHLIIP